MCNVCDTESKNKEILPCKHELCNKCYNKLLFKDNSCYKCNKQILEKERNYSIVILSEGFSHTITIDQDELLSNFSKYIDDFMTSKETSKKVDDKLLISVGLKAEPESFLEITEDQYKTFIKSEKTDFTFNGKNFTIMRYITQKNKVGLFSPEIKSDSPYCPAIKRDGKSCRFKLKKDSGFCQYHI